MVNWELMSCHTIVIAEIVVQSEESHQIKEAIEVRWNPKWNPKYFMYDYSEAELLALEASFPSVKGIPPRTGLGEMGKNLQTWVKWGGE